MPKEFYDSIYSTNIKVPKSFDLEQMATEVLSNAELQVSKQRVKDSLALFLHHVHIKCVKNLAKGEIVKNGYVPFHVTHRRELLGKSEKIFIDYLVSKGYLMTKPYLINVKSTSYRVNITAEDKSYVDYQVASSFVINKINTLREQSHELELNMSAKIPALLHVLELPSISVHPSFLEKLQELKALELKDVTDTLKITQINQNYENQLQNIIAINSGSYRGKSDRTGNRFHTRMVTMMKEFRPYLLIKGQPTAELDIKNAQPFFMQVVANPRMWTVRRTKSGYPHISDFDHQVKLKLSEKSEYYQQVMNRLGQTVTLTTKKERPRKLLWKGGEIEYQRDRRSGTILMLAVLLCTTDEPSGLNFLSLAATGNLYDLLCQNYSNRFFNKKKDDLLKDRATAKETIIKELYANHRTLQFKGYTTVLESLFPNFFLFTKLLKETNYRALAFLLQRVEAGIFLSGALESYLSKNPGSVLVTVHDSVVVPVLELPALRHHVEEYIERVVGVKPQCSVKVSHITQGDKTFSGVMAEVVGPLTREKQTPC